MVFLQCGFSDGPEDSRPDWNLSHTPHIYMVSLLYGLKWIKIWATTKALSACIALIGFSPLWPLWWSRRFEARQKPFHTPHIQGGFPPMWLYLSGFWGGTTLIEAFPTLFTLIWFLTCVDSTMDVQVWAITEAPATRIIFVKVSPPVWIRWWACRRIQLKPFPHSSHW